MILFATKSVAARRMLPPPQKAALLDEVDDPLYARLRGDAGSAATCPRDATL
jgi:hypothetical protein